MDIDMPIMNGIEATKEIRRLEEQGGQWRSVRVQKRRITDAIAYKIVGTLPL